MKAEGKNHHIHHEPASISNLVITFLYCFPLSTSRTFSDPLAIRAVALAYTEAFERCTSLLIRERCNHRICRPLTSCSQESSNELSQSFCGKSPTNVASPRIPVLSWQFQGIRIIYKLSGNVYPVSSALHEMHGDDQCFPALMYSPSSPSH